MHGVKQALAMIQALLTALTYDSFLSSIEIFLPAPSASFHPFWLSKHAGLSYSHMITFHLSTFLQADALHQVRVTQFSTKWSGLPGKKTLLDLTALHQPLLFPVPPTTRHTHNQSAHSPNITRWETLDRSREPLSRIQPPSLDKLLPIPMIRGILREPRKRNRRLCSAGTQVFHGHGFFQEYSSRFHPTADDNIICPCAALPPRFFTCHHVLIQCPLHSSSRRRHFGNHLTLDYILGTEDGGHAFANFVDETGVFLRPLPPRPDPP
jgi:hypothetical protein